MAYVITTPTDIDIEDKLLQTDNSERVVFSAWPSWDYFFKESIEALAKLHAQSRRFALENLGSVLILQTSGPKKIGSKYESNSLTKKVWARLVFYFKMYMPNIQNIDFFPL